MRLRVASVEQSSTRISSKSRPAIAAAISSCRIGMLSSSLKSGTTIEISGLMRIASPFRLERHALIVFQDEEGERAQGLAAAANVVTPDDLPFLETLFERRGRAAKRIIREKQRAAADKFVLAHQLW